MAQEPCYSPHHIKIMKVALALAIIRNKPAGVSGEEYARQLALQFSQQQTDWKERAVHLERELLRTKQELVSYQVNSELLGGKGLVTHSQLLPSQSTQETTKHFTHNAASIFADNEWTSSGYSSSLTQDDSVKTLKLCTDVSWGQRRDTEGGVEGLPAGLSSHGDHQSAGMDCEENGTVKDCVLKRVRDHVKFCSCVSSLASVHGQLSDLVTFDLRENLHETLTDAIKGLIESLKSGTISTSLSQDLFTSAATCIVDCLQLPLLAPVRADLVDTSCSLVSALVDQSSSLMLCSMLVVLCVVPELCCHGVREIVRKMVDWAGNLRQGVDDVDTLDVDLMEKTGVLLQTTETIILSKYSNSAGLRQEDCGHLIEELESSLVGVIEAFPLYCYSVWRIIGYLRHV